MLRPVLLLSFERFSETLGNVLLFCLLFVCLYSDLIMNDLVDPVCFCLPDVSCIWRNTGIGWLLSFTTFDMLMIGAVLEGSLDAGSGKDFRSSLSGLVWASVVISLRFRVIDLADLLRFVRYRGIGFQVFFDSHVLVLFWVLHGL